MKNIGTEDGIRGKETGVTMLFQLSGEKGRRNLRTGKTQGSGGEGGGLIYGLAVAFVVCVQGPYVG